MNVSHICRKLFTIFYQAIEKIGGPGGTRTPNQTVMSACQWQQRPYKSLFIRSLLTKIECKKSSKLSQSVAKIDQGNWWLFGAHIGETE